VSPCLAFGCHVVLLLGPRHRRHRNNRPNRLLRAHLRRHDVDPCALETQLDVTPSFRNSRNCPFDTPRSDFRSSPPHSHTSTSTRRRPLCLGDTTRCDATPSFRNSHDCPFASSSSDFRSSPPHLHTSTSTRRRPLCLGDAVRRDALVQKFPRLPFRILKFRFPLFSSAFAYICVDAT
jgi:hypothetical protein